MVGANFPCELATTEVERGAVSITLHSTSVSSGSRTIPCQLETGILLRGHDPADSCGQPYFIRSFGSRHYSGGRCWALEAVRPVQGKTGVCAAITFERGAFWSRCSHAYDNPAIWRTTAPPDTLAARPGLKPQTLKLLNPTLHSLLDA
jgi:hypothetical protein